MGGDEDGRWVGHEMGYLVVGMITGGAMVRFFVFPDLHVMQLLHG
jgi:hypothetical protein